MAQPKTFKRSPAAPASADIHAEVIERSVTWALAKVKELDSGRPLEALDEQIHDQIIGISELIAGQHPIELIEQGRLLSLPWNFGAPTYHGGLENGFSCVELLAIFALRNESSTSGVVKPPAEIIEQCMEMIELLEELGTLRLMVATDPEDRLAVIGAKLQSSEVVVRATSYPELVETTVLQLFADPGVSGQLHNILGFGAVEATAVLGAVSDLQAANINQRRDAAVRTAHVSRQRFTPAAAAAFDRMMEPDEVAASVSVADVRRAVGLSDQIVESVLDAFSWVPSNTRTLEEEVRGFLSGDNPFRTYPVLRTTSARALLVHPALTQGAIRGRLESSLQRGIGWSKYQKYRGDTLESRTRAAIEKLIDGGSGWHGVQYYVPASAREELLDPSLYTKRVEGDHLVLIDDVAFIVEDKAVSLSATSRSGANFRLRKDLTGIITKASQQADRLVQLIRKDGGLRIHGEGWIDLRHLREFHTIAVSLDDLTSTSTATAELVQAGLITTESVPWTVSIHDLDLIAELIAHPADFLLYLRRRRHPLATVLFTATDEMDLFLYYFQTGMHVMEDPELVRSRFPRLGEPSYAEINRWRQQAPGFVTSLTDPLDAWYYETFLPARNGKSIRPVAPSKPRRASSPLDRLIADIDVLNPYAKLSIVATLLSGDRKTQQEMAAYGRAVSSASGGSADQRMILALVPTIHDEGWLLAWASPPLGRKREEWEPEMRSYLRVKGDQLGVARAALFAFEDSADYLAAVFFEAVPESLAAEDQANAASLLQLPSKGLRGQSRPRSQGQRVQPRKKKRK